MGGVGGLQMIENRRIKRFEVLKYPQNFCIQI